MELSKNANNPIQRKKVILFLTFKHRKKLPNYL